MTGTDDGYQVDVELPGMKSKDIDVAVSSQELVTPEKSRNASAKASR
ncbi:Hsp20/alpha crystallin family protein [Streptomyces lydicus]